jgi:hypothetical protein
MRDRRTGQPPASEGREIPITGSKKHERASLDEMEK